MEVRPMSEQEILELINRGRDLLTIAERRLWDLVRVDPEKWRCPPWGDATDGFWVVGIIGTRFVWYNEIEGGFNCATYKTHGVIYDYQCDQGGLEDPVRSLKAILDGISTSIPYCGPPQAVQG